MVKKKNQLIKLKEIPLQMEFNPALMRYEPQLPPSEKKKIQKSRDVK